MDVGFETKGTNFRSYYGYWTSVIDCEGDFKGIQAAACCIQRFSVQHPAGSKIR